VPPGQLDRLPAALGRPRKRRVDLDLRQVRNKSFNQSYAGNDL